MRISDWSSDVCSSDLGEAVGRAFAVGQGARPGRGPDVEARDKHEPGCEGLILLRGGSPQFFLSDAEIARDSLSVPFRETPGDAALDELLDIGGIATDQPRDRGIILSLCADQCIQPRSYSFIAHRSEEHTSELQSLMRISYAVFCLKTKKNK